jgi:hypothetical protein
MAVVVYTVLRIALFLVIWVLIDLLTPVHGVGAAVTAILISGAISLFVLDRQRAKVGRVAAGFFGRINERIEASATAEDDDDVLPPGDAPSSGEGEQGAEDQAVDEQQLAGGLEGRDEGGPEGAAEDDANRVHGEHPRQ